MRALLRNLDSRSRDIVARTLAVMGCRSLEVAGPDDAGTLRSGMIDLLVLDADSGAEEACALVRGLRRDAGAESAFTVTVLMTSLAQTEHIARLLGCGADAVLEKPVDPVKVASRITELARRRRCFVVSDSYVGPERRTAPRPGAAPAQRLAVPNPLRETTLSGMSRGELLELARTTWEALDRKLAGQRAN
jgi:DNA-binding response OmpR family regulator